MIFQRISYRIALQFTAFVFLLLMITGTIFISADVVHRQRMNHGRLERQLQMLVARPDALNALPTLPRFQRDHVRIVDASGQSLFTGTLFEDIPFEHANSVQIFMLDDESYDVLTAPIARRGQIVGYIQVADRSPPNDLLIPIAMYLLISIAISVLTFFVGLFFARRSLQPAQQMMERLEQFTQDAGHELRTPLTSVSTSLDLALATGEYLENIRAAKKGLHDMSTLVERLLELARLDNFFLEKVTVDFSGLVLESISQHQSFAQEKKVTTETYIAENVSVEGDPTLLRQVLNNLLTNAIKFNKPHGRVIVTLTPDLFSVQDTGKGISNEAVPHIFDRFFQEDPSRANGSKEGLGLGLALTKRIVDLHGWTIGIASTKGEGTTFTVYLS